MDPLDSVLVLRPSGVFFNRIKGKSLDYWDGFGRELTLEQIMQSGFWAWGERYFTTCRWEEEHLWFEKAHQARLTQSLEYGFGKDHGLEKLLDWKAFYSLLQGKTGRLSLSLGASADELTPQVVATFDRPTWNKNQLNLKVSALPLDDHWPSNLKMNLYPRQARLKRLEKRFGENDFLWTDSQEQILEATFHNLVFFDGDQFVVPLLTHRLEGIMLKVFKSFLGNQKYVERKLTLADLNSMKSVWALNCLDIILPVVVQGYEHLEKDGNLAKDFFSYVGKHKGRL